MLKLIKFSRGGGAGIPFPLGGRGVSNNLLTLGTQHHPQNEILVTPLDSQHLCRKAYFSKRLRWFESS